MYKCRHLEQHVLDLLVGCVHNTPTEEGAPPVNTDSLVNVLQPMATFPVNVSQYVPEVLIRTPAAALHVHFDHVHGVKYCANSRTDDGARPKLLGTLV